MCFVIAQIIIEFIAILKLRVAINSSIESLIVTSVKTTAHHNSLRSHSAEMDANADRGKGMLSKKRTRMNGEG